MSPEQVRGAKLTAQSDLFSLGVVIYELFTGKNPFLKENVSLTLNEINSYNENELEEKLTNVQQNIKDILIGLLKKNINQRYESAAEVLEELNVQVDQPNIIINSINREERKTKLAWTFLAILAIVIISTVIIPIINWQKQNLVQSETQQVPNQIKNDLTNQNSSTTLSELDKTKDNVDLNKFSKPLVDSQKQNEIIKQQKENQNISTGNGGLLVDCRPWAEVFINGDSYGKTPFERPIYLTAGKEYNVKFVHPDFPPYTRRVYINTDKVAQLEINLESLTMGFLNCAVYPPIGNIYVNGNLKAQAPMRTSDFISINPGPIKLVIKNPNFLDIDTSFVIHERDTVKLQFKFSKK